MSTSTYSIRKAAALSGLPASTLRYYESIGVIRPVARGESSGHRVYGEEDLDRLVWVACLAATGMSVSDMLQYVANRDRGTEGAASQIELLAAQQQRLAEEAESLAVRQRYVALKLDYWRAVAAGDRARAESLSEESRMLAEQLRRPAHERRH